jgi:hypothetical protein
MQANPTTSVNSFKPLKLTAVGLASLRQTEDLSSCSATASKKIVPLFS